jgi:hypothetical protein
MDSSYYHLFWAYTAFFLIIHFMVLMMLRSIKVTAQQLSKELGGGKSDENKGN